MAEPQTMHALTELREALLLHQQGRLGEALTRYRGLREKLPGDPRLLHPYGFALLQSGDREAAEAMLKLGLMAAPANANNWHHLACARLAATATADAARLFRRALRLDPRHAEASFNLGQILLAQGAAADALPHLDRAVRAQPANPAWRLRHAMAQIETGGFVAAAETLELLARLAPGEAEIHFQLARCRRSLANGAGAESSYRRSILLRPGLAESWNNLRMVLLSRDKPAEAVAAARRARALRPGDPIIEYNLADALLASGDLAGGWAAYPWRHLKDEVRIDRRGLPAAWNGSSVAGGLLIFHEQGVGDELRFASCVAEAARRAGGPAYLECDARLVPLFARSFPGVTAIAKLPRLAGAPVAVEFGAFVRERGILAAAASGDLMALLRRRIADFPASPGYLKPDPEAVAAWRARLQTDQGALTVGLCWRSGMARPGAEIAYPSIEQLGPILGVPGIVPVNLQYGDAEPELRRAEQCFGIAIRRPEDLDLRQDLDGVAALIGALDVVVSAPTAVLSLAGGIGVRTIGLHAQIDYTFLGTRRQPWFPSETSLIKGGDRGWEPVIEEAAALVRTWVSGRRDKSARDG